MTNIEIDDPLSRDEAQSINKALGTLEPELRDRILASLACAAAFTDSTFSIQEGDSVVKEGRTKLFPAIDKGETKERFKDDLLTRTACRLGLEEPASPTAHSRVRQSLVWASFLSSDLQRSN